MAIVSYFLVLILAASSACGGKADDKPSQETVLNQLEEIAKLLQSLQTAVDRQEQLIANQSGCPAVGAETSNTYSQLDAVLNRMDDMSKQLQSLQAASDRQQQLTASLQQTVNQSEIVGDQSLAARPRDCAEIYESGECSDGVYTVYVGSTRRPVQVYCDMTTDGGHWLVFQRRQDGSVDFYRNWTEYAAGFGDLAGEFWLGNGNLHELTYAKRYELRVNLADFDGNSRYAEYDYFKVDPACAKYKLSSLGSYSGNAGNSLKTVNHLRSAFSTRDEDNDANGESCANLFKGGWWYGSCHHSNLNGLYLRGAHSSPADGVNWYHWRGHRYSLRFTEMKIRPYSA